MKNKKRWFSLAFVSAVGLSAMAGAITPIVINQKQSNIINLDNSSSPTLINNKQISTLDATYTPKNETINTNKYTPVKASQHTIATIAPNGYLGSGYGDDIITTDGEIFVRPGSVNNDATDNNRTVVFTTFDGIARWKFDLNELANYPHLVAAPELLRVVDIKPLHNNSGYLVLTAGVGYGTTGTYEENVLFILDNRGKLIEDSINTFSLPSFGNVASLIGNNASNAKILSPYSIKLSYASENKALIQISANPFAVKNENTVRRWTFADFINNTAFDDSFDPDKNDTNYVKTAPVVLLQYDYNLKSFDYETTTGQKVLKNYTPFSVFADLIRENNPLIPTNSKILSDMVFYVRRGIIGFYGSFLSESDPDNDSSTLGIYTYAIQSNKFVVNQIVYEELISPEGSKADILDDPDASYTGYTFSYVPFNYKSSFNVPAAELIIPCNNSFYLVPIFDATLSGTYGNRIQQFTNWKLSEDNVICGSFIDPIYGNIFFADESNMVTYIDLTQETNNNDNSIPNNFEVANFNINDFENVSTAFEEIKWIVPITSSNNIYDKNSNYFGQFAFAAFDSRGGFRVFTFFAESKNSSNLIANVYPSASTSYSLQAFVNIQRRSEELNWTPNKKKLSDITDEMLQTIGNYLTVPADTLIDNKPLFYSNLSDGYIPFYPTLNTLNVENVIRDYDHRSLSFDATFGYQMYANNANSSITMSYEISNFKVDATSIINTTFTIPDVNEQGKPYVVASPLTYQGFYNSDYDYVAGEQVALNESFLGGTYVYELIIDKPASVKIYSDSGTFLPNIFNQYFRPVTNNNGQKQVPYTPTQVDNFKGVFNPNIVYTSGSIVRESVTNKLYIFKSDSNSLADASIFQGTDLSVLLPTNLTANHIAMIINDYMISGTLPPDFDNADIKLSNIVKDNLGTTSSDGNAFITARVRLKTYYDENGALMNTPLDFPYTNITIKFNNHSQVTSLIESYDVSQFNTLSSSMYAYELNIKYLTDNKLFAQELIQINQAAGNLPSDINENNIQFYSTTDDNAVGVVTIQLSLSRWYDENGTLVTDRPQFYTITVSGFKIAIATEFTSNYINLAPYQNNVPGLNNKFPSEVTVAEFVKNDANIKSFILNYKDPSTNALLIRENARPSGFNASNIEIKKISSNSLEGSVTIRVTFNSYFANQNIDGRNAVVYRSGVSNNYFNLTIAGFKQFADNTIDNYDYNASINIDSSIKESTSWPSQLKFSIYNKKTIPSIFIEENYASIVNILTNVLVSFFATPSINTVDNIQYIVGFSAADIANIDEVYYNNFTGKIVFKVNLRQYKNEDGDLFNNTDVANWQTSSTCQYSIALEGFSRVSASTLNGEFLPDKEDDATTIKNGATIINLNIDDIDVGNKNNLDIEYSDIASQIKWGGSWAIVDREGQLVISDMQSFINSDNNPLKTPYIDRNLSSETTKLIFEFDRDVYYFANKGDVFSDNPYELGNLGEPIKLAAGSKIIVNLNNVKKFNVWEIIFWIGIAVAAVVLLSLIVFLIAKAANRRKLYY